MSGLIPFQFGDRPIRVVTDEKGDPLFVGKDVCEVLGYVNTADAIGTHCRGVAKRYPIADALGRMQETRVLAEPDVLRLIVNCSLPAAEVFERWVFEEVLPSIRRTGSYEAPSAKPTSALEPVKEFKALFGLAKLIGLDKNAAAISANQAVNQLTGTNLLSLLGQTHLESEDDVQYFNPTELGERVQLSGRKVNQLLAEAGLQIKVGKDWEVLPPGKSHSRLFDTGKKHGDGVMVQQARWAPTVLPLLRPSETP